MSKNSGPCPPLPAPARYCPHPYSSRGHLGRKDERAEAGHFILPDLGLEEGWEQTLAEIQAGGRREGGASHLHTARRSNFSSAPGGSHTPKSDILTTLVPSSHQEGSPQARGGTLQNLWLGGCGEGARSQAMGSAVLNSGLRTHVLLCSEHPQPSWVSLGCNRIHSFSDLLANTETFNQLLSVEFDGDPRKESMLVCVSQHISRGLS